MRGRAIFVRGKPKRECHYAGEGRIRLLAITAALLAAFVLPAPAQENPDDLTKKSIEDLMNMEVTSASKKEQAVSRTAAAVYVITQEDIRRSGMTSLPEILRMAPGMDVAQISSNNWAVSARGFNGRFGGWLLVLIDGRSLYSPEFAGVFWQVQQLRIEGIERIEVILGPGATLWGANAVNGVINIITKKAKDTQGIEASAGGGYPERGIADARYGGSLGDTFAYRVYGNYSNTAEMETSTGQGAGDSWYGAVGGFRADWEPSSHDALLLEGDAYRDETRQQTNIATFAPPYALTPFSTTDYVGGDVNARWTHTNSSGSEMSVQMYYDGFSRDDLLLNGFINIFNVDFQERNVVGSRNDFVWGGEYRFTSDNTQGSVYDAFQPASQQTELAGGFVQDEITVVPGKLWFTPGIRLEHAPFTGFNAEPSGRLVWSVSKNQSLWASTAQASRTPERFDEALHNISAVFPEPGGGLASVDLFGSTASRNQNTVDFEAGYRSQMTKSLSADIAGFYDHYSELQTMEPGAPFFSDDPVPHEVLPYYYLNEMHGKGYGGEIAAIWKPVNWWKVSASYTFLRQIFQLDPQSQSATSPAAAGDNPQHQFQIRSQMNLPHRIEFDAWVYYVGGLADESVPAYTRVDARLGWHPREWLDMRLVGQNLLDSRHLEFPDNTGIVSTYNTRKVFAELTWRGRH